MLKINELARLYLGIQGENGVRSITVDVSAWINLYPNGSVTVWHTRCGESTPGPTGAVYDSEEQTVTWDITSVDTFVAGIGEAEFRLIENDVIKKTAKVMTGVSPAVTLAGTELGSDWASYINAVDSLRAGAVVAQEAAEDAQTAAETAQGKAEDAQTAAEGAKTAAETAQGKAEDAQTAAEAAAARAEHASKVMVPAGGTEGQRLAKKSGTDFDMEWKTDPYYTKPAGGIPASDMAEGAIPDPTSIIDGNSTAANKVWPASKTNDLLSAIEQVEDDVDTIINGGTAYEKSINRLNPADKKSDTSLGKTGAEIENEGHWVTGFIEIESEKSNVAFTGLNNNATARVCLPVSRLCFYNQSEIFVSKVDSVSSNTITPIPENVKYVRLDLIDAYASRYPMVEFVNLIGDISAEFVEFHDGSVSSPGLYDLIEQVDENTDDIAEAVKRQNEIDAVIPYGLTWDWWISSASIDPFGNAYIGYVDTDSYAGVLRRQPDGTMQYKRLERSWNDDDHNGMATIILDDGKILVIGSHGHAQDNHIICYRSVDPYSIDEMEELSFDIPETGGYAYKTTYSQIFKYDGTLFDFMRVSVQQDSETITNGVGYLCLVSEDDGDTWTAYKAIQSSDPYISFAMSTDEENVIKGVYTNNPGTRPANMIKGFTFDMDTYEFADLSGTKIGELVLLDGGVIADEDIAHYADMTDLVARGEATKSCRLFYVANTPTANTTFLYAIAEDSTNKEWKYKMYQNGTVIDIGYSGVPFGSNTYISGACFGKDTDTAYYAKATTLKADGNHELHKVILSSGAVDSDSIITESSICIIRPLFLGNGEIAVLVGHYNDQNSDGTYKGKYTNWELKPLFVHASSGGSGAGSDLPNGEGVEF